MNKPLSLSRLFVRWTKGWQSARKCSSAVQKAHQLQTGDKIHGYTVDKVMPVPELYLTSVKLTHDRTGAQHLHIARDDSNNVFGVALRTTPLDDTGVPHILEHTALCGSQQYPVRDPFFKMLNRSLSTFMNAFTSTDWTMYPFSTQNATDYSNLMSVYLDAVFFPLLRETDFNQEGWRLEHEEHTDQNSPIIFKGVVFNEMKGVFSNSQALFAQKEQNYILPSHTYATCYGGDPASIPTLTWEHLKEFHASHYHPSNARFYTYGNLPVEKHLEQINDTLRKFDKIDPNTEVPLEPRWDSPREFRIDCQPDPMCADQNKQTTLSVSYLLNDVTEPEEAFTLSFLSKLLTDGETAPFYSALIEPNIGSDFAPGLGYDNNSREARFSVGLKGIAENDVDRVKQIIAETFDKVVVEGFDPVEIEAKLHEVELALKHQTTSFGLNIGINLVLVWNHDADPTDFLQTHKYINKLQDNLKQNPRYLQDKVKQYFKDNTHRMTLVMSPAEDFETKRQEQETDLLQSLVEKLSSDDKQKIYEKGLALADLQNKEEDLSILPTLDVSDIDRSFKEVPVKTVYAGTNPIQTCVQSTNGVTYFKAISNIDDLPADLKPYLPLFCEVATSMGAGEMDYKELSQQSQLKTGGLNVDTFVASHLTDPTRFEQGILISSHCLDKNMDDMFGLWTKVFTELNLEDNDRLTTLIRMSAAQLADSIPMSGHHFAMMHAASSLSPAGHTQEMFNGMSQVNLMKSVAENTDIEDIANKLRVIGSHVLSRWRMRCALNATASTMDTAVTRTEQFLEALKHVPKEKLTYDSFLSQDQQFKPQGSYTNMDLQFQVNYIGRCIKTVPLTHEDYPSLQILAKLMAARFLHREIREKGGAYGGGALTTGGQFSMFSYRDPNSVRTLQVFEDAISWACRGDFSRELVDAATLGVFQKVDMPVPPSRKGMERFLSNFTDDLRHEYRLRLLDVHKDQLVGVAQKYLARGYKPTSVTLLGPEKALQGNTQSWNVQKV